MTANESEFLRSPEGHHPIDLPRRTYSDAVSSGLAHDERTPRHPLETRVSEAVDPLMAPDEVASFPDDEANDESQTFISLQFQVYKTKQLDGKPVEEKKLDSFKWTSTPESKSALPVVTGIPLIISQLVFCRDQQTNIPVAINTPTSKNAVLFLRGKKDVDYAVELAEKCSSSVAALLLDTEPGRRSKKFPIFVLEGRDMLLVSNLKHGRSRVYLHAVEGKQSAPLVGSVGQADLEDLHEDEKEVLHEDEADHSRPSYLGSMVMGIKGRIKSAAKQVKNFFSSDELHLSLTEEWKDCGRLYYKSMKLLDEFDDPTKALPHKTKEQIVQFFSSTKAKPSNVLCQLVFSIRFTSLTIDRIEGAQDPDAALLFHVVLYALVNAWALGREECIRVFAIEKFGPRYRPSLIVRRFIRDILETPLDAYHSFVSCGHGINSVPLLEIWASCGISLIAEKIQWSSVRATMLTSLSSHLPLLPNGDDGSTLSLFLLVGSDLYACHEVLCHVKGNNPKSLPYTLLGSACDWVSECVVECSSINVEEASFRFLEILSACDVKSSKHIIDKTTSSMNFSTKNFFDFYSVVHAKFLDGEIPPLLHHFERCMVRTVSRRLRDGESCDILALLQSPLALLLEDRVFRCEFFDCCRRNIKASDDIEMALNFVGDVSKSQYISDEGILKLVETLSLKSLTIPLIKSAFRIAFTRVDMFVESRRDVDFVVEQVSIHLLSKHRAACVFSEPDECRQLLEISRTSEDGAQVELFSCLISRLKDQLVSHARTRSVLQTLGLCNILLVDEPSSLCLDTAHSLLLSVFEDWKGCSSLLSILDSPQPFLRMSLCWDRLLDISAPFVGPQSPLQQLLAELTNAWMDRFNRDELQYQELKKISQASTDLLETISRVAKVTLPPIESFTSRLKHTDEIICETEDILKDVSKLLADYACVDDYVRDLESTFKVEDSRLYFEKSISEIETEAKVAQSIVLECEDTIEVCGYFREKKSIIFRKLLIRSQTSEVTNHIRELKVIVSSVVARIKALFACTSLFENIGDALDLLSSDRVLANSMLEPELEVLRGCPLELVSEETVTMTKRVAVVYRFRQPLQGFTQFCRDAEFSLLTDDEGFSQLVEILCKLDDSSSIRDDDLQLLQNILVGTQEAVDVGNTAKLQDTLSVLDLLSAFQENPQVRVLGHEMRWLKKDGMLRFREQLAIITNVLTDDAQSYEAKLLDSLLVSIQALSFIESAKNIDSVAALIRHLAGSEAVRNLTREEVSLVHCNAAQIRGWFTEGVDDASLVPSKYKCVVESGIYSLSFRHDSEEIQLTSFRERLEDIQLQLAYKSEGKKYILCGQELERFVRDVAFLHSTPSTSSLPVSKFVEQYHNISKAASNIVRTWQMGRKVATSDYMWSVGDEESVSLLLAESEKLYASCSQWIESVREMYPETLLYWQDELFYLFLILQDFETVEDGTIRIKDLTSGRLSYSATIPDSLHNIVKRTQNEDSWLSSVASFLIPDSLHNIVKRTQNEDSWLSSVASFLHCLHIESDSTLIPQNFCAAPNCVTERGLHLHSVGGDEGRFCSVELQALQWIYKSRLPFSFEVLDCSEGCTQNKLTIFFARAMKFVQHAYVIMNIHMLEGELLEHVILVLRGRELRSSGASLHCIQREGVILHTGPWIKHMEWNHPSPSENQWRDHVIDGVHIESIAIIGSSSPGTGKTRHIHRMLKDDQDNRMSSTASIVIHERTSLSALTHSLSKQFIPADIESSVHFSFQYAPDKEDNPRWLESINLFFLHLLVLRYVHDPRTSATFSLGKRRWRIWVELPAMENFKSWLRNNIPVLFYNGHFEVPVREFQIDEETRRVCTYLRALEDGTINRKFQPNSKEIIFVIDISGSMMAMLSPQQTALSVAIDNALLVFDSHLDEGDTFGVVLFNHEVFVPIASQQILNEAHKEQLRGTLCGQRNQKRDGGTNMYPAIEHALLMCTSNRGEHNVESWIVCLTDGVTAPTRQQEANAAIRDSSASTHIVVIGVNLHPQYEDVMRGLCRNGFYESARGSERGLRKAFQSVSRKIPVSKTFELDGRLSDEECRRYLNCYSPKFLETDDMLLLSFWVRFLYRRVKILDENESFNYNETQEKLGESLMFTMLDEVERLMQVDQKRSWTQSSHAQLIYDFTKPNAPEFRLICTAPRNLDVSLRQRYEKLDLPGFYIPSEAQLRERDTLDQYLSQALNVPLSSTENGNKLKCIDDEGFILTLDFTMKLLNIHERVACGLPCVLEGETGVSKTALTKMYGILLNSSLKDQACASTQADLAAIRASLLPDLDDTRADPLTSIEEALEAASETSIASESEFARNLVSQLKEKCANRSRFFKDPPSYDDSTGVSSSSALIFLEWFARSELENTFFEINVDSSLDEAFFTKRFDDIERTARKLAGTKLAVVVFLDEINTSSVMGLMKEIVVDRSITGKTLSGNIVIVAACNPNRNISVRQESSLEKDLGKDWASGHYCVTSLPPTLFKVKWAFGSLSSMQEKDFIFRRFENILPDSGLHSLRCDMTELIAEAHETIRSLAYENLLHALREEGLANSTAEDDARHRASSVVSLREIQRVFGMFEFFVGFLFQLRSSLREDVAVRQAMLLSISVVYYMRLDSKSRRKFRERLNTTVPNSGECLQDVLDDTMDEVSRHTPRASGIALTRGLKENLFMTLVCCLSRTPLLIVGPPGSSKTLSVNTLERSANGVESTTPLFRKLSQLSLFHYQCSRKSTSREIASVFERAVSRQEKLNECCSRCVVFMDEAGLPEEGKESLKVLHYLLEGHMSAKANVGFVAISNHVLDAAKTNRCAMLLREEPDGEELLEITKGVLLDKKVEFIEFPENHPPRECSILAEALCRSYSALMREEKRFSHLRSFFGLRDYIYFLKALRDLSRMDPPNLVITLRSFLRALQRNFNGTSPSDLEDIADFFLDNSLKHQSKQAASVRILLDDPCEVFTDAMRRESNLMAKTFVSRARFKLVIDCTDDDSIMRLLFAAGVVDPSDHSLFKLSNMPEDRDAEESRLVCGVRYAAASGRLAVLSQTERVNESFYDLFNQNFCTVRERDDTVSMYANIAMNGLSRRSRVSEEFACIVHLRGTEIRAAPAPFLNRFEKYRIDTNTVFNAGWSRFRGLSTLIAEARNVLEEKVVGPIGESSFFGLVSCQTIESIFISFLPRKHLFGAPGMKSVFETGGSNLVESLRSFFSTFTSLSISKDEMSEMIGYALEILSSEERNALKEAMFNWCKESDDKAFRDAVQSIVAGGTEPGCFGTALSSVIRAIFIRRACCLLLQIATPEAIFACRHVLPREVISHYFRQEHFNLRRLIGEIHDTPSAVLENKFALVYTRSDGVIHQMGGNSCDSSSGEGQEQLIRNFVFADTSKADVAHLSQIRSESALQSKISLWTSDKMKSIFVLVVDMGQKNALDMVNFSRTLIEQKSSDRGGRTFILLLHYPQSVSIRNFCYPALFLGSWRHFFLDGVGKPHEELFSGIGRFLLSEPDIQDAQGQKSFLSETSRTLENYLPSMLLHVATHNFFYENQIKGDHTGERIDFTSRCRFLTFIMQTSVGKTTVGNVLCGKFAQLWTEGGFLSAMTVTSTRLLNGASQLSMSVSVQSILLDAFSAFLLASVIEMNQWRNLDTISGETVDQEVAELFGFVLERLPVAPLEELISQQGRGLRLLQSPLPQNHQQRGGFPFFSFFYSVLTESVECSKDEVRGPSPPSMAIYEQAKRIMETCLNQSRNMIVSSTMTGMSNKGSLSTRYLRSYIVAISGLTSLDWIKVIESWVLSQIVADELPNDIVAIHVVGQLHQEKILGLASWSYLCNETSLLRQSDQIHDIIDCRKSYFYQALRILEGSLTKTSQSRREWYLSFDWLMEYACSSLESILPISAEAAVVLRVLFLIRGNRMAQKEHVIVGTFYDSSCSRLLASASDKVALKDLHAVLDKDQGVSTLHALSEGFLTYPWTSLVPQFIPEDVTYVVHRLNEIPLSPTYKQTLSIVLHCKFESTLPLETPVSGLSSSALQIICANNEVGGASRFADGNRKINTPHHIPVWLRNEHSDKETMAPLDQSGNDDSLEFFFRDYSNSCAGDMTTCVFDIVLGQLLSETAGMNSEKILLRFLRHIEEEYQLERDEAVRRTRLRRISGEVDTFRDSLVSVVIADGLLVCLVTKIVTELVHAGECPAISGTYRPAMDKLFSQLFSLNTARWADFFFGSIIAVRGEGTLSELLAKTGALGDREWCKEWAEGVPESIETTRKALAAAERELANVESEEERKETELRLCPHCNGQFLVGAENCREFYCGRDAHGNGGNPAIGGIPVREVYGCGRRFRLEQSGRYTRDTERLGLLRAKLDEERQNLCFREGAELLWRQARSFKLPKLRLIIDAPALNDPFSASLRANNPSSEMMVLLNRCSRLSDEFTLLPYLVEFYSWIHGKLALLMTRDKAISMKMNDLIDDSLLSSRFDMSHTNYVMKLWSKVSRGLDSLLKKWNFRIFYDCDEINLSLSPVEEAPVISFLSEGNHPTDGNDFLFLIIRFIVGKYNDLIRQIELVARNCDPQHCDEVGKSQSIHPAGLIPGSGGAVALHRLVRMWDTGHLDQICEQAWNDQERGFDFETIGREVREMKIIRHLPPEISSTNLLRTKFTFRAHGDEESPSHTESSVHLTAMGLFVSSKPDAALLDEVWSLITDIVPESTERLAGQWGDFFHALQYTELRSILTALRNLFRLFQNDHILSIKTFSDALTEGMQIGIHELNNEREATLQRLDFPKLDPELINLFMASDIADILSLVQFIGDQLSCEGHIFAQLPLLLKEPLPTDDCEDIDRNLRTFEHREGSASALSLTHDFVRDVLAFYQKEIIDAALIDPNASLVQFLCDDNPFCDRSDPAVCLLPSNVLLRHYVSTRCFFHRWRLRTLYQVHKNIENGSSPDSGIIEPPLSTTARDAPNIWLFDKDFECSTGSRFQKDRSSKFWFETGEPDSSRQRTVNASKIQFWWRCHAAARSTQGMWKRSRNGFKCHMTAEAREITNAVTIQRWWRSLCLEDLYLDAKGELYSMSEDELSFYSLDGSHRTGSSTERSLDEAARMQGSKKREGSHEDSQSATSEVTDSSCMEISDSLPGGKKTLVEWVEDLFLPSSTLAELEKVGVRVLDDVFMVANECPDVLNETNLATLDKIKILKAARNASSA